MKYDVFFSDGHVETVEVEPSKSELVSDRTLAEVTAVGQYPGTSSVLRVIRHIPMVDLGSVPRSVIDYIQRVYDEANKPLAGASPDELHGYVRGIEFMVLQLHLPIRLRH